MEQVPCCDPQLIESVVEGLCRERSRDPLVHRHHHDVPLPSVETLSEIMEMLRSVLFPGYFGPSELRVETMRYYTGATLDRVERLLSEQVRRGFCYECTLARRKEGCEGCDARARNITDKFLQELPRVRDLLATDAMAAYEGDPAALSPGETVFCYPSMTALANHRIAHELFRLGVPLIPRILSEQAHSKTGIDLHPGATVGERFFMDHGTGIVIGETCIIGNNVRLYQGVTLGAKSFPLDESGNPIKGIPRHPVVEDDAIIYAGATILGRVTIGKGAVVGGNVWLTRDVAPGSRILQGRLVETAFQHGAGI